MNILFISDLFEDSNHSSVNGIFESNMKRMCSCDTVYFSNSNKSEYSDGRIYIPYRCKRNNILEVISSLVDIKKYDYVIIRNFFPVLKQFLAKRCLYEFKVGFWESFPHSYRGLHQALYLNKSVYRKKIEYFIKNKMENRLLSQVDFYLPITNKFYEEFRSNVLCPVMPMPMGVDMQEVDTTDKELLSPPSEVKKFIYIGVVDQLRMIDVVVRAFSVIEEEFVFDIYTASENKCTSLIRSLSDNRIQIKKAIPRKDLMKKMNEYDVGIGLIPENKLYLVSSPTKTLEYYSVGIPSILNNIPDYHSLFDEESAFFCEFDEKRLSEKIREILLISKGKLELMGSIGKDQVIKNRDYKVIASKLMNFMKSI